jgi:nucleoside-diphosphate kinase
MKTLLMVKPDAVAEGIYGDIIAITLRNKFDIKRLLMREFTREMAAEFYAVHRERPFYGDLVDYITSGPVVAIEIEGDDVVTRVRELIGATNPEEARPGTIRVMYGKSLQYNAVHGSDSPVNAEKELAIAFGDS